MSLLVGSGQGLDVYDQLMDVSAIKFYPWRLGWGRGGIVHIFRERKEGDR